jgi:hypothetical protein
MTSPVPPKEETTNSNSSKTMQSLPKRILIQSNMSRQKATGKHRYKISRTTNPVANRPTVNTLCCSRTSRIFHSNHKCKETIAVVELQSRCTLHLAASLQSIFLEGKTRTHTVNKPRDRIHSANLIRAILLLAKEPTLSLRVMATEIKLTKDKRNPM